MTLWDSTNRADGRSAGLVGLIYPSGLHVECFKNNLSGLPQGYSLVDSVTDRNSKNCIFA